MNTNDEKFSREKKIHVNNHIEIAGRRIIIRTNLFMLRIFNIQLFYE